MPTQQNAATPCHYDVPPPLGATLVTGGTQFACYADRADSVDLCLFDDAGRERRVALHEHAHGVWAGHVAGVEAGQRYGFRVHGPYRPREGDRHNPAKLLLDPYAHGIVGEVTWRPEVFGHVVGADLAGDGDVRDDRDSASYVPRSVVVGNGFDWDGDRPPRVPWSDTVIYEAHVRGLTMAHPRIPERLRGTYAGIAHPATIAHLVQLGVTTLELLPVHAFTSEPRLIQHGLTNYWGYNTLGFFAPHAAYAACDEPLEVIREFKGMVKLLHAAGIEVVLDVVYNHTCEQASDRGATLSWRGMAGGTYYRLDDQGADVDVTGCGNTLDLRQPVTMAMVLDSLRYWVGEMHVDGFRFDLAVALARGGDDSFHADHPFLMALRTDPVLSRVKLIAEPWDVGSHGWRTGQFPAPMAEWNDRFRDTMRTFWLTGVAADSTGAPGHGLSDLGTRIAGSGDLFGGPQRPRLTPLSSINMVTAHDGFTAADLTAYDRKHNEDNQEDGRDGSDNNHSWNFGVEGHAGAGREIESARRRAVRNLLGSLFLSAGVPMLLGGDELGRTQAGNNNAYCQDNPLSWVHWATQDHDLTETVAFLAEFRAAHPVLRQRAFFPAAPVAGDDLAALRWYAADGQIMTAQQWNDPRGRTVQVAFDGTDIGDARLLFVLHGGAGDVTVRLPKPGGVTGWDLVWDSICEHPEQVPSRQLDAGGTLEVTSASLVVLQAVPN